MRIKILFATISILAMAHVNSFAQSEQNSPKTQKEALQQVTTVTGYVTDWLLNIVNDFNGFNLQTNSVKYIVKFPASMISKLREAIKIGSIVTVNGFEIRDSMGLMQIKLASIVIDGKTIQNDPPILAETMPADELIYSNAKIRELQKNVDGKVTGYILDNKTILRLSSNILDELVKLLIVGANISYSGIKSDSGSGEDAWASYTIIRCQTITIHGKQYLTQ